MENNKTLITTKPKSPILAFAYLGKDLTVLLEQLKSLASPESWDYTQSKLTNKPLPILHNYLFHTFARIQEENKICIKENYCCFNTGLGTSNHEEIFMLFKKGTKGWYFLDFCKESDSNLMRFTTLPDRASYFENPSDLIIDSSIEIRINIDHIVEDQNNFSRFPDHIKSLPKHQLINTFKGAIDHARKRVKRNYKTAIPQYYRGYISSPQLQLLLPLCLTDHSKADLALAIYKDNGIYSGRTCLTLDMAINNARLIAKPDDEWLKV